MTLYRKLAAIVWKDALTASSYRVSFILRFAQPVFPLLSFFFVARMLDASSLAGIDRYGGDYFPFAMVGIIFNIYMALALTTVVNVTRQGQTQGFLESILVSRTGLPTYVLGSSLYPVLLGTVSVIVFVVVGQLAFGVDLGKANVLSAAAMVLFAMVALFGVGVFSAALVLAFKEGAPINVILGQAAFLLSGVVYPVDVLPSWLQVGSALLPHTYALDGLRLALLQGYSIPQLGDQIGALMMFAAVTLPLGLGMFRYAMHRARVEGTFAQF